MPYRRLEEGAELSLSLRAHRGRPFHFVHEGRREDRALCDLDGGLEWVAEALGRGPDAVRYHAAHALRQRRVLVKQFGPQELYIREAVCGGGGGAERVEWAG